MIPFLDRLPTADEVRAHAASHPAKWPCGGGWSVWSAFDGVPTYVLLSADDEGVWLPDGDMLTERRYPLARWLPCTAEGIPVFALPVAEGAAGDLLRERVGR